MSRGSLPQYDTHREREAVTPIPGYPRLPLLAFPCSRRLPFLKHSWMQPGASSVMLRRPARQVDLPRAITVPHPPLFPFLPVLLLLSFIIFLKAGLSSDHFFSRPCICSSTGTLSSVCSLAYRVIRFSVCLSCMLLGLKLLNDVPHRRSHPGRKHPIDGCFEPTTVWRLFRNEGDAEGRGNGAACSPAAGGRAETGRKPAPHNSEESLRRWK